MKTTFLNFYKHIQQPQWKQLNDSLKALGCVLLSWLSGVPLLTQSYLLHVCRIFLMRMNLVLAALEVRATLVSIKALVKSAIINNRVYVGLILVVIVAPFSTCIHMLPGMKDLVSKDWFYQCYYNLYLVLGPYFFCVCIVIAAFLWIPPVNKRIKFSRKSISFQLTRALSIPLGLVIGKIIWLTFLCDSNDDFERLGHWSVFAGGIVIGYATILVLDYLVWRQEHVMNAHIDSLQGVYSIKDLDHETRDKMAAPYWNELRQFNSKY